MYVFIKLILYIFIISNLNYIKVYIYSKCGIIIIIILLIAGNTIFKTYFGILQ